jgi:hypothetical protein
MSNQRTGREHCPAAQAEINDLQAEVERRNAIYLADTARLRGLNAEVQALRDTLKQHRPRSNIEIIEQTMDLADKFYGAHGYIERPGYNYMKSTHPQERLMWAMACVAQEVITNTDPMDAVNELEGES